MKKNTLSWLLYDFANSFWTTALGSLFLAQWLIIDNGLNDIWYGSIYTIATILVFVSSPLIGVWSDKIKKRLPFVKITSWLLILFGSLLVITVSTKIPIKTKIIFVLILATLIQYFYQISLIFTNALLETISNKTNRGLLSGWGEFFNNLGFVLSLAFFLFIVERGIRVWGEPGRTQVFLPALVLFFIFSIPMLFMFREKRTKKTKIYFAATLKTLIKDIKKLFSENRNLGIFLLGFSFVSDAVLTLNMYFAIVLDKIYGFPDTQKFPVLMIMILTTVVFGIITGKLADRFGNKKIVMSACVLLIISFIVAFLSSQKITLMIITFFAGVGYSGYYVATRSWLIELSPKNKLGEYFSYYSVFQRFASIIGPMLWGFITLALVKYDVLRYRIAGLSLVLLIIIGTSILIKVKPTLRPTT